MNLAIFISTAGNGGLNALARLSCVIWLGPEGARRCLNVPPATAFAPLNFPLKNHQAAALGRAETRSCQALRLAASSGIGMPTKVAKSMTQSAVMSATVKLSPAK